MAVLALLGVVLVAHAQFPGMGKKEEPPKAPAAASDIKFIKCQVCRQLHRRREGTLRRFPAAVCLNRPWAKLCSVLSASSFDLM